MSSEPSSESRPVRRTTFTIPNLHSHEGASSVEDSLFGIRPRPLAIETSVASNEVVVEHDTSLSSRAIATTLREAGYEVNTTATDPTVGPEEIGSARHEADDDSPFKWISRALGWFGWGLGTGDKETERIGHGEKCEKCCLWERQVEEDRNSEEERQPEEEQQPEHEQHDTNSPSAGPSEEQGARPFVVVDTGSVKWLCASLSTPIVCGVCVGAIKSALEKQQWVKWTNVSSSEESTTVVYDEAHSVEELVNIIEETGRQATVLEVDESRPDLWKGSYSITGMTSSSCARTITEALEALSWIQSVDINRTSGSVTVLFDKKKIHLFEIVRAVESVGYEATLNNITDAGEKKTKYSRRTVSIRVDGMPCQHCPGRVTDVMKQYAESVTTIKPVSFEDPIMVISYVPWVSDITIRTITSAIDGADPSFHTAVYHPPTVEEAAKRMNARIRRQTLRRLVLAIAAAIPSFIICIVYMNRPPSDAGRQDLMREVHGVTRAEWATFVMATPVYFFAAYDFHRGTIMGLCFLWNGDSEEPVWRRFYRFGSMDMLISFGTTIAYFASVTKLIVAAVVEHVEGICVTETYFDAVVFLTTFILIGRLVEASSKAKTVEAVSELGSLRPKDALLVLPSEGVEGSRRTQNVHVDLIESNDIVKVMNGDSPPWDGFLIEGTGEFDESNMTGESRPVKKKMDDLTYSGTINQGGPILMRVSGAQSMLDQMINVVREGQSHMLPTPWIDKVIGKFVPMITLLAIATWLIWLSLGLSGRLPDDYLDVKLGGWVFWSLRFAIAVFVTACPCGIGLAAPTAIAVGVNLATKYGLIAKGGGEAFQGASKLDIIVFDKTGTLTKGGELKVTDHKFIFPNNSAWTEQLVFNCVAELESSSSHPVAKAMVAFCESKGSIPVEAKNIEEIPGKGMKGLFDDNSLEYSAEILVGNEVLLADHGVVLSEEVSATLDLWKGEVKSIVIVAGRFVAPGQESPWEALAIQATSDLIRPEARSVIETLHRRGIKTWMLSGDNLKTALAVGVTVGIPAENIMAGVLPNQKADKIKYLQGSQSQTRSRGLFRLADQTQTRSIVAMVGDGVNDSAALIQADVGIAIGSGSNIAIAAAEFVLVKSNLTALITLINLSRAVSRRVKFNIGWAFAYNLATLPVAAGVFYPLTINGRHFRLDPARASLFMASSSISVIFSSLLLKTRLPLVGSRNVDATVRDD
ncbi:E1-E2 ATPase-domain-containing protein [Hypoxylon rubiginosum]|uniref:E1-E2 ATPase-domain-containing protein n=1 Tax=Hypoxylon rubiginosum TaxID=110542 RepID=A0ACC0CRT9_9PEZI|nr:E1-E2 ATPase-domain-containing protein [Hypoxylon rubiginosum]